MQKEKMQIKSMIQNSEKKEHASTQNKCDILAK